MQPTWKILDIFLRMNEWIKPMHCSMKVDIMRCVHNICTTCMYTWWCNQLGWNPIWRSILIFTHMLFQYVKKVCTTLDLLALIPFKLKHSQLVSLWKSSHSGYKKWYCHFYTCQINKGDIWLQFENNEKNPPGGAVIQKNQKQILKSWYLHYWHTPRGARGVKRCARIY